MRSLIARRFDANRTLAHVAAAGIDLPKVTAELEREGIEAFCASYHELLDCVESKLSAGKGLLGRL